jgi:RNA-directed DNA polymerase
LKWEAAPAVEGVTWHEYGTDRDEKPAELHGRIHRGMYRAQTCQESAHSASGWMATSLGHRSPGDKIVQHAVATVHNQIYEEDFVGFSYGYRPGRSQHQALDALWVGIMRKKVNWILDADLRGSFDSVSHKWLVKFIGHRVADRRILNPTLCMLIVLSPAL